MDETSTTDDHHPSLVDMHSPDQADMNSNNNNDLQMGFATIKISKPNKSYQQPIITNELDLFQSLNNHNTNSSHNGNNLHSENSTSSSHIEMTSSIDSLSNDNNGFCGSNGGHMNGADSANELDEENTDTITDIYHPDSVTTTNVLNTYTHNEEETVTLHACLTETTDTLASISLANNLADDFNQALEHISPLNTFSSNLKPKTDPESTTGQSVTMLNQKEKDMGSKSPLMKDMNKEERLRLKRDKDEQELAKRKKELEENLKRKQDLWCRQQKEKQKRIDEYKCRENEKRLACEERRKKQEELERNRLNELVKRERTKLMAKSNMKGSEWTLSASPTSNSSNGHDGPSSNEDGSCVINKSQSAYNLSHKKKESLTPDKAEQGMSKRLANSTVRLSPPNGQKYLESTSETNEMSAKRRSRTVPTTPLHHPKPPRQPQSAHHTDHTENTTTANFRTNLSKMMHSNASKDLNKSLYWEGPPAHFMLPTHAIHCRLSRSVERCPRACKAAAEAAAAEEAHLNAQKPLQTITERNKPLPAHLQETINRLSMPKKPPTAEEIMNNHHSYRSGTPLGSSDQTSNNNGEGLGNNQATASSNSLTLNKKPKTQIPTARKLSKIPPRKPTPVKPTSGISHSKTHDHIDLTSPKSKKIDTLKTAARKKGLGQSSSNGSIVSLNSGLNQVKKSNSSSTLSLHQAQTKTRPTQKSNNQTKPPPTQSSTLTSNSSVSCDSTTKRDDQFKAEITRAVEHIVDAQVNSNEQKTMEPPQIPAVKIDQPAEEAGTPTTTEEIAEEKESNIELEATRNSSNSDSFSNEELKVVEEAPVEAAKTEIETPVAVVAPVKVDAPIVPARALTEEEEYKIKLEEKRREAREKAAKEAEIERQRQELIAQEEERKRKEEEEQERLAEEELNRLHKLAREQEEERLRVAMELNERLETERREKEEMEKKVKEENERKAREEAEKAEEARLEKIKKEEEERLERRKKIDLIMRRVHNKEDNGSTTNVNGSTGNLLISASNNDLAGVRSMTSSLIHAKDNNDNSSTTLAASMTTSMITPSVNEQTNGEQQIFKTPLLQSILSKTRITTILNKYADDPLISNPTLSLLAQNASITKCDQQRPEPHSSSPSSDPIDDSEKTDDKLHVDHEEEDDNSSKDEKNYELEMTEVNVVVEDSSSGSSSPSSPGSIASSASSGSSQQASPPAPQTPTTPSQTQISA